MLRKQLKCTILLYVEIAIVQFQHFLFLICIRQFSMNRKQLDGKQIKVQASRSSGRRDVGRGGDRGGYRGDRDGGRRYDDRGPRRDFGDRPKGCFNCGKEGHFARDCTEPRKPREFDRDRNDRDRNDRDRRDRGRDRDDDRGYKRRSRSRSGDRHRKHKRRSSSGSRSD